MSALPTRIGKACEAVIGAIVFVVIVALSLLMVALPFAVIGAIAGLVYGVGVLVVRVVAGA